LKIWLENYTFSIGTIGERIGRMLLPEKLGGKLKNKNK
jgi:hypothetical protein